MLHWYALHTKPHKEAMVRDLLVSRGVEVYFPVLPPERGKKPAAEHPLFARYLFARLNLTATPLSSINYSQGMSGVVCFGGEPAVVPDEVLRWLRARIAQMAGGAYHQGLPLLQNARVRITGGPLKGAEAVFDRRLSGQDRARVFVRLLGQLRSAEISLADLEQV